MQKYLMPSALCPWGDCEYPHQLKHANLDLIIQRCLPKCLIVMINNHDQCSLTNAAREDYTRPTTSEYDKCLLNPAWKVLSSIAHVHGGGPLVLTCRNHEGGIKK